MSRRLSVCHVVLTDSPYGAFNAAVRLAEAQSKSIDVAMAMNHDAVRFLGSDDIARVQIVRLPLSLANGWPGGVHSVGLLRAAVASAKELESGVDDLGVDVLHFHLPNAFILALTCNLPALPRIMTVHGVFYETLPTRSLGVLTNRLVFRHDFRVSVVNRDLLGYASRLAHTPVGAIAYIPNGIAQGRVRDLSWSSSMLPARVGESNITNPTVAFVGRLEKRKGPELLLGALPRLSLVFPGLMCIFVGDGPLRGALEENARRLGVLERVVFAGFQANPYGIMKASSVIVTNLSAALRGVSLVHFEAGALGKPVVTLFDPEKHDAFGDSIYYAREESAAEVERVVREAICDVDAKAAKVAVFDEKRFSWETASESYIRLYQSVARTRRLWQRARAKRSGGSGQRTSIIP